jgi:hypothetical protein
VIEQTPSVWVAERNAGLTELRARVRPVLLRLMPLIFNDLFYNIK